MTVEQILDTVDIQEAMKNCPWSTSDNAIRTSKKEIVGNRLIRKNQVIAKFFGERAFHVEDKEQQLRGTDFKTFSRNIDAKVSIGDYTDDAMHFYECIPVELTQNGKITFTKEKDTTDVLFVNVNTNTNLIWFVSVPMEIILKIVEINLSTNPMNKIHPFYIPNQTSMNGSGVFVKLPINRVMDLPGVKIEKIALANQIEVEDK